MITSDENHKCQWCGSSHATVCPMIKAIEYFESVAIKRVEFKTSADYSQISGAPLDRPRTPKITWWPGPSTTCGFGGMEIDSAIQFWNG